jgi:uncharacterized protein
MGAFFKEHDFLVGLSADGPREIHNTYRVDRNGKGTFDLVMKGWRALRKHQVDFNILCTVNVANQAHGRTVYRFFRDELGAKWVQFIPIVERATAETLEIANQGWREHPGQKRLLYTQQGNLVTERTVGGEQYGRASWWIFSKSGCAMMGAVFVQLFDVTLEAFFGRHLLCIHAPTCGTALALEHNGDLYSCDHFVEPRFRLGNIHETHMLEMGPRQQRKFGQDKLDTLTAQCRSCPVRAPVPRGCPKDRFALSRDGEAGHNHLCAGLELFFIHTSPAFLVMRQNGPTGSRSHPKPCCDGCEDARRDPINPARAEAVKIPLLSRRQTS